MGYYLPIKVCIGKYILIENICSRRRVMEGSQENFIAAPFPHQIYLLSLAHSLQYKRKVRKCHAITNQTKCYFAFANIPSQYIMCVKDQHVHI